MPSKSRAAASEKDALAEALLFLRLAPPDDRLYDVSFGRYADGSGCWWTMSLVTEVRNGEVQRSPEGDEKKTLAVITAWCEAFNQPGGES
jgi:hypothetical protein